MQSAPLLAVLTGVWNVELSSAQQGIVSVADVNGLELAKIGPFNGRFVDLAFVEMRKQVSGIVVPVAWPLVASFGRLNFEIGLQPGVVSPLRLDRTTGHVVILTIVDVNRFASVQLFGLGLFKYNGQTVESNSFKVLNLVAEQLRCFA